MASTTRNRLREVIAAYDHAADLDGEHFAAAAEVLTAIVRTATTRTDILARLDGAITDTDDTAVLSLLHNSRHRLTGDLIEVGRRANDTVNARITSHGRTA